jgi:hypothetical protein
LEEVGGGHGRACPGRPDEDKDYVDKVNIRPDGNSSAYFVRRLKRDAPELVASEANWPGHTVGSDGSIWSNHHPQNLTESAPRKRPFCAFSNRPCRDHPDIATLWRMAC